MPEHWQIGGFGLYIHWPFCKAKCPYCDFNSHVAQSIDHPRWQKAFLSEIDRTGAETQGRILTSVFFGGGTPSLMPPELVSRILERVRDTWTISNDFEVTLEANPTSVEASRFRGYREAGVNRVSIGVQALNDADLRALGRQHSVEEAKAAFELARNTFDRVSMDLIYARQGQSLSAWKSELGEALEMAADHLSLYQLTIEDGTAFGDRFARGKLRGLPDLDTAADMFLLTQNMCEDAGMPAYEVSNHARAGAQSRHNLIYWRQGDYAGIGPGAHGRLSFQERRFATDTPLHPDAWLERVEHSGSGEITRTLISPEDQAAEYLMMGLRITEGVSLDRLGPLAQEKEFLWKIKWLEDLQMVTLNDGHLSATKSGQPVLNAIIRELLPEPT